MQTKDAWLSARISSKFQATKTLEPKPRNFLMETTNESFYKCPSPEFFEKK